MDGSTEYFSWNRGHRCCKFELLFSCLERRVFNQYRQCQGLEVSCTRKELLYLIKDTMLLLQPTQGLSLHSSQTIPLLIRNP